MPLKERYRQGIEWGRKCRSVPFELARVMQEKGIDPELSLHSFCVNLMRRFSEFEDGIRGCGSFDALSQERLEELWREFNAKV
ncbi:MAG: hypothetical protein ACLRZN_03475 [Dialister invisus]